MLRQRSTTTSGTAVTEILPVPTPKHPVDYGDVETKKDISFKPDRKRSRLRLPWILCKSIFWFTAFIYLILPFWVHFCPWVRRQIILLPNLNLEFMWDLSNPEIFGLPCAKHTYVYSARGVRLGLWHIPPTFNEEYTTLKSPICFKNTTDVWTTRTEAEEFDSDRPVILYFHGTGFTRAAPFRRDFYRILTDSALNAHVVTFDYRGFADSSSVKANMVGILEDAEAVYKWLYKRVNPKSRLLLWGHSLGSGIAVQLAAKFAGSGLEPHGVILESTFTNMLDAVNSFPFSSLHKFWPGFQKYVASVAANHPDTYLANDDKIHLAITSPFLILHAEDDNFLTVDQARKVYRLALKAYDDTNRSEKDKTRVFRPRYIEFEAELGYGHKHLSTDPRLPNMVLQFLKDIANNTL